MNKDNKAVISPLVIAAAIVLVSIVRIGQPIVEKFVDSDASESKSKTGVFVNTSPKKSENISSNIFNLDQPKEPRLGITVEQFRDTTWKTECANCSSNLKENYIRLKGDGTLGYNNDKPEDFVFDGTDVWRVEGKTLIISNSNGYSVEKYIFAHPSDIEANGTISNVSGTVYIERLE